MWSKYVFNKLYVVLTQWGRVLEQQSPSYSRTSDHFMEPIGSLLCSQESTTGPYPKPDESIPYNTILYIRFISIPAHQLLDLPSYLFPVKSFYALVFFPVHFTFHLIVHDIIIVIMFGEKYELWSLLLNFPQLPSTSFLFVWDILLNTHYAYCIKINCGDGHSFPI
jgi:hypothetical protein